MCFHQADQFVPVDNGIFAAGLKWLLQQQNTDGSFAENMRVIHYQMQVHCTCIRLFTLNGLDHDFGHKLFFSKFNGYNALVRYFNRHPKFECRSLS